MNQFFKYHVPVALFTLLLSVSACRKEEVFTRVNITGVTVTQHPSTKSNGQDWDDALAGYYPDIYFGFYEPGTTNELYSIGPNDRYENAQPGATLSWNTNYIMQLSETFDFDLYDFDSFNPNEYMGTVNVDLLGYSVGNNAYPSQVTLSNNGITVRFTLQWLE